MCSRIIIEQRQEEQASEQGGGGGGGGVLVGRSVGLLFSWCRGTYELPTFMPLSFHLFIVAILFCFLCSWAVLVLILSFIWTREVRRLCCCCCCCGFCVRACVRACVFFPIERALLLCVSFHLAFWLLIFRHNRRGLVGLNDSLALVFFFLWFDVLLFVRNVVLSLSLSRGLFSFLLCIYRGSDNCCCCCCCCFFASLG